MDQEALINASIMDTSFNVSINDQKDPNNHFQLPVSPPTPLENLNLPYDISVDRIRLCDSPMNFLQQFNYTSEDRAKNDMYYEVSNNSFISDKPINPFKSSTENDHQHPDQMDMVSSSPNMHMQFMEPSLNKEQQVGNDKDSIKHESTGKQIQYRIAVISLMMKMMQSIGVGLERGLNRKTLLLKGGEERSLTTGSMPFGLWFLRFLR